ncbi:MAG: hypothetical protein [Bacteriophage sp.]|nr:MAG: hypothetical protein [Bacteriophage sp.]
MALGFQRLQGDKTVDGQILLQLQEMNLKAGKTDLHLYAKELYPEIPLNLIRKNWILKNKNAGLENHSFDGNFFGYFSITFLGGTSQKCEAGLLRGFTHISHRNIGENHISFLSSADGAFVIGNQLSVSIEFIGYKIPSAILPNNYTINLIPDHQYNIVGFAHTVVNPTFLIQGVHVIDLDLHPSSFISCDGRVLVKSVETDFSYVIKSTEPNNEEINNLPFNPLKGNSTELSNCPVTYVEHPSTMTLELTQTTEVIPLNGMGTSTIWLDVDLNGKDFAPMKLISSVPYSVYVGVTLISNSSPSQKGSSLHQFIFTPKPYEVITIINQ